MRVFCFIVLFFLGLGPCQAQEEQSTDEEDEIYIWADENGVRRFSDTPPPVDPQIVEKIKKIPYDAVEDQRRTQEDKRLVDREYQALEVERRQEADLEKAQAEESGEKIVEAVSGPGGNPPTMEDSPPADSSPSFGQRTNKYDSIKTRISAGGFFAAGQASDISII